VVVDYTDEMAQVEGWFSLKVTEIKKRYFKSLSLIIEISSSKQHFVFPKLLRFYLEQGFHE